MWTNVFFYVSAVHAILHLPVFCHTEISLHSAFEYLFHDVFAQHCISDLVVGLIECKSHASHSELLLLHLFVGQSFRCYTLGRHSNFPWSSCSRADEHEAICWYRLFSFPAIYLASLYYFLRGFTIKHFNIYIFNHFITISHHCSVNWGAHGMHVCHKFKSCTCLAC